MKKNSKKNIVGRFVYLFFILVLISLAYLFFSYLRYKNTALLDKENIGRIVSFKPDIEEEYFLGKDDAPITIVVYTSIGCPSCISFHEEIYPYLKKNHIDTGKARYYHKFFALPQEIEQKTGDYNLSRFLYCAGRHNKPNYYNYYEVLFRIGDTDFENLLNLNLDSKKFSDCYVDTEQKFPTEAEHNILFGVVSQPTIFIGVNNVDNIVLTGVPTTEIMRKTIKQKEIELGMV